MAYRELKLRYPAVCSICRSPLDPGVRAFRDPETKSVMCPECFGNASRREDGSDVLQSSAVVTESDDPTRGGASARHEFERRHDRREARLDAKFGRLAGVVKFLFDDPQSTRAWAQGSAGERELAASLQRRVGDRAVILHDRRRPGTRANIDHLVIAASGVWIVDAKRYKGLVERRDVGGWFRSDVRLYVGGRNRTGLTESLHRQETSVVTALDARQVPIHRVLCFVDAEWRLFSQAFTVNGALVTWGGKDLADRIAASGPMSPSDVLEVGRLLSAKLPPALKD